MSLNTGWFASHAISISAWMIGMKWYRRKPENSSAEKSAENINAGLSCRSSSIASFASRISSSVSGSCLSTGNSSALGAGALATGCEETGYSGTGRRTSFVSIFPRPLRMKLMRFGCSACNCFMIESTDTRIRVCWYFS